MTQLFKRLVVILLAGTLVFSFVACKNKKKDDSSSDLTSSTPSSQTQSVPVNSETHDDGDELTSSELEKLEEELFGGGNKPTITPSTSSNGNSNSASSNTVSTNGPGITVINPSSTPATSESSSSSSTSSAGTNSGSESSDSNSSSTSSKDYSDDIWTGRY